MYNEQIESLITAALADGVLTEKEKQILFSTVPLGKEAWQPVTFTTLLAYQEGKKLFIGTNHGEEYKNDTQNIQSL